MQYMHACAHACMYLLLIARLHVLMLMCMCEHNLFCMYRASVHACVQEIICMQARARVRVCVSCNATQYIHTCMHHMWTHGCMHAYSHVYKCKIFM